MSNFWDRYHRRLQRQKEGYDADDEDDKYDKAIIEKKQQQKEYYLKNRERIIERVKAYQRKRKQNGYKQPNYHKLRLQKQGTAPIKLKRDEITFTLEL